MRNWKRLHKRVCTTDPLLRRYVPVEMAVERLLAKQPKVQAPKDATCYICLEGDDGGKLMRGCACRGDSAGFVHIQCLTELAVSKEASREFNTSYAWRYCGNCKQDFQGALELEMKRRCWLRHRSSQDLILRYNSTTSLATCLAIDGEFDVAHQLVDEASTWVGNDKHLLLDLKLSRADLLIESGQKLDGLELLQTILPETKQITTNPGIYGYTMQQITDVLLDLNRNQEAHEMASELVAFAKAKFGLERSVTLIAMTTYAGACAKLGRVEEAKEIFEEVLSIETRVLGRDHPQTQFTLRRMRDYGFAEPSCSGRPSETPTGTVTEKSSSGGSTILAVVIVLTIAFLVALFFGSRATTYATKDNAVTGKNHRKLAPN